MFSISPSDYIVIDDVPDMFVQEQPSGEVLPESTEEAWRLLGTNAVPDPSDTKAVAYAQARKRWINMNRFFMRAWADDVLDFSLYGIWALRDGLESLDLNAPDSVDPTTIGPRALRIETAAACVEEAPEALYKCREIMGPNGRDDWTQSNAPGSGGTRWTGVDGFHPDRWALWKTVFGEIAANNGQYKMPDHVVDAAKVRRQSPVETRMITYSILQRALAVMEKTEAAN